VVLAGNSQKGTPYTGAGNQQGQKRSLERILRTSQKIPVYPISGNTSIIRMECNAIPPYVRPLTGAIAKCVALVVIIPCAAAFLLSQSVPATLALITSTLIIEYGAAPVGIGLGLHPVFVLVVLTSVALGITLCMFDVFDTLGRHSGRVARFLARSEEKVKQSTLISKYGIYGLVPCVLTLGLYVCPPVSWALVWRRDRSILLIMGGFIAISAIMILVTLGLFSIIFH
jgi:hypothetical protein